MIEGEEVVGWKQRSIACWALVIVLWAGTAAAEDSRLLNAGDVFPDFSLERSDGSIWRMSDYSEHPKIIMFWATWCPYCRKLFPGIVALNRQYEAHGLEIVAVNFRDDGDTDAYARKHGLDFEHRAFWRHIGSRCRCTGHADSFCAGPEQSNSAPFV